MSITIEPFGGLGNQLFIYALGLQIARERGTTLTCDTWQFHDDPWRAYELDTFMNSVDYTYSSRSRELLGRKTRRVIRGGLAYHLLPNRIGHLVMEQDSTFDPRILESPDGSRLAGYFQSWRYFHPIVDEVRDQVSRPVHPSAWMHQKRSSLRQIGAWTAVHVRRGDYVKNASMGLVGNDYYRRAVAHLDRLVGRLPIVVFSDSPELVAGMETFVGDRVSFVDTPAGVRAIDVLQVMSDASHLVIGNSTFSWWAAFLRDQPGRTVIAPRPWIDVKRFNERDLLPPDWITLGR